jgi:hypothetical protein
VKQKDAYDFFCRGWLACAQEFEVGSFTLELPQEKFKEEWDDFKEGEN